MQSLLEPFALLLYSPHLGIRSIQLHSAWYLCLIWLLVACTVVDLRREASSSNVLWSEKEFISAIQPTLRYRFLTKNLTTSQNSTISHIVWKPNFHYHDHKSISLVPVLSQMNSVHALPSYFLKTHFNIMLPSTTRFSNNLWTSVSPPKSSMHLSSPTQMPQTCQLILPAESSRLRICSTAAVFHTRPYPGHTPHLYTPAWSWELNWCHWSHHQNSCALS